MVDAEWYRSFVGVYRLGSVSAAAETRFLTQPAVSGHIAALEKAVGTPLFVRMPRRMVPTERGKELYVQIAGAVDVMEQVTHHLKTAAYGVPTLRFGAIADHFDVIALPMLKGAPFLLRVQFDLTHNLLAALERHELDLALVPRRVASPALEYRLFSREPSVVVAPPDMELPPGMKMAALPELEAWLVAQPWVSYAVDLLIIRHFWQQVFGHRPQFTPALVVPDLRAVAHAVSLGKGLSVISKRLCAALSRTHPLTIAWEPPRPVLEEFWIAYRRADRAAPHIQEMCNRLTETHAP